MGVEDRRSSVWMTLCPERILHLSEGTDVYRAWNDLDHLADHFLPGGTK